MYATVHANTLQVTFYKVPEKHGHSHPVRKGEIWRVWLGGWEEWLNQMVVYDRGTSDDYISHPSSFISSTSVNPISKQPEIKLPGKRN